MAKTRDYMDYLDEFVEISPANSEEEYQAAEVISSILKDHALETSVENFETHPSGTVMLPILMCIMFVCLVAMGLTDGTLRYGILALSVLCAGLSIFSHFAGNNIFLNFGPASQSQNVVAVHRATGDKVVKGARPIVIVAHYDTPREGLLRKGALARFQTSLPRLMTPLTIVVLVVVLLQAIPMLPATIRTFLWVIGVLVALPVLFMAVTDIYGHFAPCTQGANDNKSSVAALLSIASRVRPGEDRVDRYIENGNESLLRRAGDKPAAPPMPKYVEVVEETKGVRHGAEVLLSLGILPPDCDVVYEEPRVTLVQEGVGEPGDGFAPTDDVPQDDVAVDAEGQLDDMADDGLGDVESFGQEELPEDEVSHEYLEVLDDPEEADFEAEEEVQDEEAFDEDEEEIYDDEELFADDEAPGSLIDWAKERWAGLREFFSRDRGSDLDIDRGQDRTTLTDEESEGDEAEDGDLGEELVEEEITFDDEESYEEEAPREGEAAEESEAPRKSLGLADKIPGFDDVDDFDDEYDESDEPQEDEAYDDEEDKSVFEDEDEIEDDEAEAYDEEEEVYLEDLEPEPLEFEQDEDEEYEDDEYADEEAEDEEYVEESEEADEDDAVYEDEVEDDEEAYEEDGSEEYEDDEYEYEDEEYEYVEEDEEPDEEYEDEPGEDSLGWDEDEATEEQAANMPTRIIEPDESDEFDLDEEEYQEDYEEYEDEEEYVEEEPAPTFMERLKGFFRGLREVRDQADYGDEYDYEYEEEYGYEDDDLLYEDTPEEDLGDGTDLEGSEAGEAYGDEDFVDDGYDAEDEGFDAYDEAGEDSPLPDDLEQSAERLADPNVLHLDDYDEESDLLPKDTTGLDTISDSYDLYPGEFERAPQRDKPEPVVDPSWGVTSYQPARPAMNIARRAALLDLPDPSEAFVDPLSYVGYGPYAYEDDEYDEYAPAANDPQASSEPITVEQAATSQAANTVGVEQYYDESYMQLDELADEDMGDFDWELEEPSNEEGDSGQQSFWGTGDPSEWKGGATQRADLREDADAPIVIDADSLQDAILELGDEYLVAHDIWFVATGASETDHAGIRAFMEAHKREIRGAFLVNLDSIGAGSLSILVREGLHVPKRADRRLVRMLTGIAQDLHIQIETAMLNWTDRESTVSMRSRIRSVTIMGLDENNLPANSHTQDDVPELVNPRQVSSVVRIVTELIRRS